MEDAEAGSSDRDPPNVERTRVCRVAILGGGISGLSVAHQLVDWNTRHGPDYEITVFESRGSAGADLGGKARSWRAESPGGDLAGEHGFRFFPGFYQNVTATMGEIPAADGSGSVVDHLVPQGETAFHAHHLASPGTVAAPRSARSILRVLNAVGPFLTAIWLLVLPVVLWATSASGWIWFAWAAAMPLRTLVRWIAEAASADGTAALTLPLRTTADGVEGRHGFMKVWDRIPAARWLWIPLVIPLAVWRPPWPVWLAATIVAVVWTFWVPCCAMYWLWKSMRGRIPHDVKPRAAESLFAVFAVFQLVMSCPARMYRQWDSISWWEYIGAWRFSERFQLTLATGLTRSFVATKAEHMSARTGGSILAQLIYDIDPYLTRDEPPDRVLDGPTSEVWIEPWVEHLAANGVLFNVIPPGSQTDRRGEPLRRDTSPDAGPEPTPTILDHCLVQRLAVDDAGLVSGFDYATKEAGGPVPLRAGEPTVAEALRNAVDGGTRGYFDHYVLAVPGPAAQRILGNSADVLTRDRSITTERPHHPMSEPDPVPHLDGVFELEFGWMTGIVFHLDELVEGLPSGHVLCLDSEWALTAIDERPVWSTSGGDDGGGTILSVDVSDWFRPSSTGLPARFVEIEDITAEVWRQLTAHLPQLSTVKPPPATHVLLDTAITDPDPARHALPVLSAGTSGPGILDPSRSRVPDSLREAARRDTALRGRATSLELENLPMNNADKLLINTAGSWQSRPCAVTAIRNLFIAGDYVRTSADFASMESADESARWVALGIIGRDHPDAIGEAGGPDEPAALRDPEELRGMLTAARALDRLVLWCGLPNPLMLIGTPIGWIAGLEDRFRSMLERRFRPDGLPSRS